jgi:predicted RNA-binding protein with PUA-like domain
MAYWLLKTEPSTYSYDDLVREGRTAWDGVANAMALKHLRDARPGDLAIVYHTGDERRAVGMAEVVTEAYPDPRERDPKRVVVDVVPRGALVEPVGLDALKASPEFAASPLVRIGRLSVVPLEPSQWTTLLGLAGTKPPAAKPRAPSARKPPESKPVAKEPAAKKPAAKKPAAKRRPAKSRG